MNSTFIVAHNGPHFVPLLITPAITDVNLYNHIIGYTQRMNLVQDIEEVVRRELSNYYGYPPVVQNRPDYKIFFVTDYYSSDDYDDDEIRELESGRGESLPYRSEDMGGIDLVVIPAIKNNALRSYVINLVNSDEFVNFVNDRGTSTHDINELVENKIREYQASH